MTPCQIVDMRAPNFHDSYRVVLEELVLRGVPVSPRGQPTIEVQDVILELPPETDDGFAHGRTDLRYLLAEMAWYCSRDPSTSFIRDYASLWGRIENPDGTANSNYGEKIWTKPFDALGVPGAAECEWQWCLQTLQADQASRQAVMVIHRPEHHWHGNKDVPCTLNISFAVRGGRLQTRVHMRSSDAWFGLPYDVPFFLWLHRRMAANLGVAKGVFRITLDSLHLYLHRVEHARNYLAKWRPAASWVNPIPHHLPLEQAEWLAKDLLAKMKTEVPA